ncbi:MAG: M15 family metallopeptidase [Spirochaetota bacterium]
MNTFRDDEEARRTFWKTRMDEAFAFMVEIERYPLAECGEALASLPEAAAKAGVRVLFSELPHVKGLPRLFYLRQGLIDGFIGAAAEMNRLGWVLKVEDGYRSRFMQKHNALRPEVFPLVLARTRWELGGSEPSIDLLRRRLAALIAMNPRVGTHCIGSAIDISVLSLDGTTEIDRGAGYLELSELTPMDSPFVSAKAKANREKITALMASHGFSTYAFEFWHYNAGDAYSEFLSGRGKPARYGPVDFDPGSGSMTPIADATTPLNSEAEIAAMIDDALRPNQTSGG